jgi:hypothetical protein
MQALFSTICGTRQLNLPGPSFWGLLASVDAGREMLLVRRTLEGTARQVLSEDQRSSQVGHDAFRRFDELIPVDLIPRAQRLYVVNTIPLTGAENVCTNARSITASVFDFAIVYLLPTRASTLDSNSTILCRWLFALRMERGSGILSRRHACSVYSVPEGQRPS